MLLGPSACVGHKVGNASTSVRPLEPAKRRLAGHPRSTTASALRVGALVTHIKNIVEERTRKRRIRGAISLKNY